MAKQSGGLAVNGGAGHDVLDGGALDDKLKGGSGDDQLYGFAGDDDLKGDAGNDTLDGGAGSDKLDGGSGDDLLIWVAAQNANTRDEYDGGSGRDTLRLVLTRAEWESAPLQSDIARYVRFLDGDVERGEAKGKSFRFNAFDLTVGKVEKLELVVDGRTVAPGAPLAYDDAAATDERTAVTIDVRANDVDAQGDTLTITGLAATSMHGAALTLNANGTIGYDPTASTTIQALDGGETLSDTFTYTVSDGKGGSSTAMVSVTLAGRNSIVEGTVQDGYIFNATVFADANGNGVLDPDTEIHTTTDLQGRFTLVGGAGPIVATGGVDTATNLAFEGVMRAPEGYSVVTPLTTLVAALAGGMSVAAAEAKVLEALGLPSGIDLATFDPIAAVSAGDPQGAAAFVAATHVLDALTMMGSFIAGATGVSNAAGGDQVLAALAAEIAELPIGGTIDLESAATLSDVLSAAQPDIGATEAAAVAEMVAQSNAAASDAAAGASGVALLAAVTQVGIVAQGEASASLEAAGAAPQLLDDTVAAYTGAALDQQIAETAGQTGDVDGPDVENAPIARDDSVEVREDDIVLLSEAELLANDLDFDGHSTIHIDPTSITQGSNGFFLFNAQINSWFYRPNPEFSGSDSFSYTITDGVFSSQGTVHVNVVAVNDTPMMTFPEQTVTPVGASGRNSNMRDPRASSSALNIMSEDGDYILTRTTGNFLTPGEYLTDLSAGVTTLFNEDATTSADGRYTVFTSLEALDAGDTNAVSDVYIRDATDESVRLISADASGTVGNAESWRGQISADGRYAGFLTEATNLSSGVLNHFLVKDLETGRIEGVGKMLLPSQEPRYTLFTSEPGLGGQIILFVEDRVSGVSARIATGGPGLEARLSLDGSTVVFSSINNVRHPSFRSVSAAENPLDKWLDDVTPLTGYSVTDVDAGDDFTAVLTADYGTFSAGGASGLISISGEGTGSLTLVGSPDAINAALDAHVTYARDAGFDGLEPVRLTVTDAEGASLSNVLPTIRHRIDTEPDFATVVEGDVVVIDVLANDVDLDPSEKLNVLRGMPELGFMSVSTNKLTYHTDNAFDHLREGETATVDFTYVVRDKDNMPSTGTGTVTVIGVNNAPFATNSEVIQPSDVTVSGVIVAFDVDNDASELTYALDTGPTHGALTLDPDGAFTYTPDAGFTGTDAFTYAVSDLHVPADTTGEITIRVGGAFPLTGGDGNDLLVGGAGADALDGGQGSDTLTGGAGADRFAYGDTLLATDVITDFNTGEGDVLDLSAAMSALGLSSSPEQYLRVVETTAGTEIVLDGNNGTLPVMVLLAGVTGVTLESLLSGGSLVL